MKFNDYLKKCREKHQLTQEQLTVNLQHSYEIFLYLDVGTLSRWERGVTHPNVAKKMKIIELFQEYDGSAFPCFSDYGYEDVQEEICHNAIENVIGKSKELVLNFPSHYILADELKITELKDIKNIDNIIDISITLDQEFTQHISLLQEKHFKEWASHPSSFFLICEYKEQFFGLLFTLKLKQKSFEKIMNLEIEEKDLTVDDFANADEEGSSYLLNFFSHSQKSAALLFIRYYAYLVANQKNILEVGVATIMNDAQKLIKRLNVEHYRDIEHKKQTFSFYRSPLKNMLMNEAILKTIFNK